MPNISRRTFIKIASATAATFQSGAEVSLANAEVKNAARKQAVAQGAYTFLNAREAAFIEAAAARLIPADETGPGAIDAGVPSYIDKQLGGAWGAGERLYRSGPWQQGAPTQGYQLQYTPAQLFRNALRAIDDEIRKSHS